MPHKEKYANPGGDACDRAGRHRLERSTAFQAVSNFQKAAVPKNGAIGLMLAIRRRAIGGNPGIPRD
jgi:hypothetical protein